MTPSLLPRCFLEEWSPEQALAVYDFCRLFADVLWEHYEHELIEVMIERDRAHGLEQPGALAETNLELPFEDEIPD